ncbi:MAG: peptidoglycan-binding protein [bacterium]|nr:peptidoglycan-binding protein [bacterium]
MTALKNLTATALALSIFAPSFAFAQTTSTTSAPALIGQIQSIQTQINALKQQQQQYLATLQSTLAQGSAGEQVATLQALLASDPSLYPEGIVSGFYGRLTADAVKRFQKKNGIDQVGFVGPKTLKKLQEYLKKNPLAFDVAVAAATSTAMSTSSSTPSNNDKAKGKDKRPCAIVPPGHLIAPGWLKKHKGEDRQIVPECQKLPKGIKDLIERDHDDDDDNDHGTTTPPVADVVAPVISSVNTSGISTTTVSINWFTNELATSKVYFGTTPLVNLASSTVVSNNSLVSGHTLKLMGLVPSTTYYYVVESRDVSLNTSTSSTLSFVTSALPIVDATAPVISSIGLSNISATTAMISWITNEAATSKLYYATTTPVNLSTALSVSNLSLVTNHIMNLAGLTASTTYYYVLESKDAAANSATTSTQSFVTTN